MPEAYYAIAAGSSLAALTNVEALATYPPNAFPDRRIPLMGATVRRTAGGGIQRSGKVAVNLPVSFLAQSDHNAFVYALFGGFTTPSVAGVVSAIDETGYYSPFTCKISRPMEAENFRLSDSGKYLIDYELPLFDLRLVSTTITTDTTITSATRLVYVDTTSGNVAVTLPAANSPAANTVFSVVKTAAANTLTLKDAAAATVTTVTAQWGRKDVVSDGSVWIVL